jgi:hypothetical protein
MHACKLDVCKEKVQACLDGHGSGRSNELTEGVPMASGVARAAVGRAREAEAGEVYLQSGKVGCEWVRSRR